MKRILIINFPKVPVIRKERAVSWTGQAFGIFVLKGGENGYHQAPVFGGRKRFVRGIPAACDSV